MNAAPAVRWVQVARACATESRRCGCGVLRQRLRALAAVRVSWGYKRLHVLLRREGWTVNHKRIYRLCTEGRLALKRRRPKRPKRRRIAVVRAVRPVASVVNERWAMDFVHDVLSGECTSPASSRS